MTDEQEYAGGRALLERTRQLMGAMNELCQADIRDLDQFGMRIKLDAMLQGRNPTWEEMLNPTSERMFGMMPNDLVRRTMMDELDRRSRRLAIHQLWARGKTVYAIHPHLLTYLSTGAVERGLPVSILERVKRPNPFILLPSQEQPRKVAKACQGTPLGQPLLGCYLFGKFDNGERLCDLSDERRDCIGLQFVNGALDSSPEAAQRRAQGVSDGTSVLRATVPLAGTFSVDDAVQATVARFRFDDATQPGPLQVWLPWAVRQVLLSVLYICTDEPDIADFRRGANKVPSKKGKRAPKASSASTTSPEVDSVAEVGFKLGPTLHRIRMRSEQRVPSESAAGEGGWRQPPHLRGPSPYALYWTGPGGSIPAFKGREGYWVHREELEAGQEASGPVTVIPVK